MGSDVSPSMHHVPSGGGAVANIRRFATRVVVPGEATGGRYSVLEHALEPGYVAMPLHRHGVETKTLYVLSGRLSVRAGDDTVDLGPGASVTVPAGTWHGFWNARPVDAEQRGGFAAGEPATFLAVVAPGGLEAYYAAVAALVPGGPDAPIADIREVLAVSATHGVEVQMDSLLDFVRDQKVRLA